MRIRKGNQNVISTVAAETTDPVQDQQRGWHYHILPSFINNKERYRASQDRKSRKLQYRLSMALT